MRFPSVTIATLFACATVAHCVDVNGLPGSRALHSGPKDKYAEDDAAYAAAYDDYHHATVERDAYRYRPEILPRRFRHRSEILPREEYEDLAERDARNRHLMILLEERSVDASHEAMDYADPSHDRDFVKRAIQALPILGHALAEEHAAPIEIKAPVKPKINEAKTVEPEEDKLALGHAVVNEPALPTEIEPSVVKPKVNVAKPSKTKEPEVFVGHALAESRPLPARAVEYNYHSAGHVHHPHHRPSYGVHARSTEEHDYAHDYDYAPYSYDEYDHENEEYYYYPYEDSMDFRTDMPSAHEYEIASSLQSEQDQQFNSHHGSAVPDVQTTVSTSSVVSSPSPAVTPAPSTPISTAATAPTPAPTPVPTASPSVSKTLPIPKATSGLKAGAAPAATAVVDTATKTLGATIAKVTDFVKNIYDGIREGSVEAEGGKVKEGLDFVV